MIWDEDKLRENAKSWDNAFKKFREQRRWWQEIMDNIDESDIDDEEQIESTSLIDHNVETANLDSSATTSETLPCPRTRGGDAAGGLPAPGQMSLSPPTRG